MFYGYFIYPHISSHTSSLFGRITVNLDNGKWVVLHDDFTWEYVDSPKYDFDFSQIKDNVIPNFLRKEITANAETIKIAVEMYLQGWRYTMPRPKTLKPLLGAIAMVEPLGLMDIGIMRKQTLIRRIHL